MPIRVRALAVPPVIEKTYHGVLTRAEVLTAMEESLALVPGDRVMRVLSDCRELETMFTEADFYGLKDFLARGDFDHIAYRQALVRPNCPEFGGTLEAWVSVATRNGLVARIFDTRERALDWLMK